MLIQSLVGSINIYYRFHHSLIEICYTFLMNQIGIWESQGEQGNMLD